MYPQGNPQSTQCASVLQSASIRNPSRGTYTHRFKHAELELRRPGNGLNIGPRSFRGDKFCA
eukprot:45147-Alexandrium_andersonii.AAC.1